MSVLASRVSVGTTATKLAERPGSEVSDSVTRRFVLDNNAGAVSVFLGGSDVTTSTGFEWKSTHPPLSIDLEPGEALYGVVASGTVDVHVLGSGR